MGKLFFISLFVFFSLQKVINAAYGNNCSRPLDQFHFTDFSISHVVGQHEERYLLGKWVYFFFSHFTRLNNVQSYADKFDVNSLDQHNKSCFIRALTIFLIHMEGSRIRQLILTLRRPSEVVDHYKGKFNPNNEITRDFLHFLGSPSLLRLINSIKPLGPPRDVLNYNLLPVKKMIKKKGKDYVVDEELANKVFFGDVKEFRALYVTSEGSTSDSFGTLLARDYNFLALLGTKNNYYPSDVTLYTVPNISQKEKKRRLLILKRSKTFQWKTYGVTNDFNEIYNPCYYLTQKNQFGDFGHLDDLATVYTSIIQQKMVLGHKRFLVDFNNSISKGSWRIKGLKGFRAIKQFFSRSNLSSFVKMYLNLISREWSFIINDFVRQFEATAECEQHMIQNKAGRTYYNFIKGKHQ